MQSLNDERPIDKVIPEADRPNAIKMGFCAKAPLGCGKKLDKIPLGINFRDEISYREYHISGLCQACQDIAFAEPPE